jgi:hypothetical protein
VDSGQGKGERGKGKGEREGWPYPRSLYCMEVSSGGAVVFWRSLIAVSLSASLLAAVLACRGSSGAPAPSATPEPSATVEPTREPTRAPTPTAAPTEPATAASGELSFGDPVPVPEDVAIIVETGCWSCGGSSQGLVRVYRDPSGRVRSDVLFHPDRLNLPRRVFTYENETSEGPPPVTSFALAEDGSDMVATLCTAGDCGFYDPASPDAETALFRSRDGGVTWREVGRLDGGYTARGLFLGEVVLHRMRETDRPGDLGRHELFPSGKIVDPPGPDAWWPAVGPRGELVWSTEDGLVDADGEPLLDVAIGLGEEWAMHLGWNVRPERNGDRLAASIIADKFDESGSDAEVRYYLGLFAGDGSLLRALPSAMWFEPGRWLEPDLIIGNFDIQPHLVPGLDIDFGFVPAIFDLASGVVHPMPSPFLDGSLPLQNPRNLVSAAMPGPFARVSGTNSCLRVREAPDLEARALDCAADGVLLYDRGEKRVVEGVTWVEVATPAGVEGWSSAKYLER